MDDVDHITDNGEFGLDGDVDTMFTLPSSKVNPIQIAVEINSFPLLMELDTGASLSVISEKVYKMLPSCRPLQPTSAQLITYTGESIKELDIISVAV